MTVEKIAGTGNLPLEVSGEAGVEIKAFHALLRRYAMSGQPPEGLVSNQGAEAGVGRRCSVSLPDGAEALELVIGVGCADGPSADGVWPLLGLVVVQPSRGAALEWHVFTSDTRQGAGFMLGAYKENQLETAGYQGQTVSLVDMYGSTTLPATLGMRCERYEVICSEPVG